jgi:hypothetical protein
MVEAQWRMTFYQLRKSRRGRHTVDKAAVQLLFGGMKKPTEEEDDTRV